jgi:hypothetical protein
MTESASQSIPLWLDILKGSIGPICSALIALAGVWLLNGWQRIREQQLLDLRLQKEQRIELRNAYADCAGSAYEYVRDFQYVISVREENERLTAEEKTAFTETERRLLKKERVKLDKIYQVRQPRLIELQLVMQKSYARLRMLLGEDPKMADEAMRFIERIRDFSADERPDRKPPHERAFAVVTAGRLVEDIDQWLEKHARRLSDGETKGLEGIQTVIIDLRKPSLPEVAA